MFGGSGGLQLAMRSWQPETPARGVVVIQHGFLAHSGQYQWSAEQFTQSGLAVYALDMRGHGKSGGRRYWVESFDDLIGDMAAFLALVRTREHGKAIVLLGHSAGGLVATTYAQKHPEQLAGLICESFAFQIPVPELALQSIKLVARLFPNAPILRLKPKDFSRDPAVVAAIENDPLVNHEPGPAHTIASLVRSRDHLAGCFGKITLPLLILHGTADRATMPAGSQRFHREAGSQDNTLKLYDGHYHDLLADVGREQVMADIQQWIDARIPIT
jgi:alpha-beta hydrolase superfamily lysophospholipase